MVEIYDSLRGSRINNGGELCIQDFERDDYEELWRMLVETAVIPNLNGGDFFHWLGQWAVRYRVHRFNNRYYTEDIYDPLTRSRPDELNTRQQLAIIKFYMHRRKHSGY